MKKQPRIQSLKPVIGMLKIGPAVMESLPQDPTSWRANKTSSTQRGYGYRWKLARDAYLKAHPICVMCEEKGLIVAANVVDHRIAHRGDQRLFWDRLNWQSLCKPHHDSHAQKRDREAAKGAWLYSIPAPPEDDPS